MLLVIRIGKREIIMLIRILSWTHYTKGFDMIKLLVFLKNGSGSITIQLNSMSEVKPYLFDLESGGIEYTAYHVSRL
jgi:hypothetical protein